MIVNKEKAILTLKIIIKNEIITIKRRLSNY
jgi:hypothetical protein